MVRCLFAFLVVFIVSFQSNNSVAAFFFAQMAKDNDQFYNEQLELAKQIERQKQMEQNVAQLQQTLTSYGYKPGPIDGIFGRATVEALKSFCKDFNYGKSECFEFAGRIPDPPSSPSPDPSANALKGLMMSPVPPTPPPPQPENEPQEVFGPDGKTAYQIDCSGYQNSFTDCMVKAGKICKARDYDIIERQEKQHIRTILMHCK